MSEDDDGFTLPLDDSEIKGLGLIHGVGVACAIFRVAAGKTQREVAEAMGTTVSAISRFENGRGNPTLSFCQRYAREVGVTFRMHAAERPEPS